MKKLTILGLVLLFLIPNLFADEKAVVSKAEDLLKQKKYDEAVAVLDEGIKELGYNEKLMRMKFSILLEQKKYDDALALLDLAIKEKGESAQLLEQECYIYMEQKKYDAALKAALKMEELAKKKRPWNCLEIANIYIKLNDRDNAFKWLAEAVDRGYLDYPDLIESAEEAGVAKDPRLAGLVEKIKSNIGIGKPATDFTVKLLGGKDFQLSSLKGKVVLLDFWATWCPPCRAEIPNLKGYYAELHKKGFEILGISLDSNEDKLKDYIKKNELAWLVSFSGKGWGDETAGKYGVISIPSYWLIDKKGNLRHFGLRKEELKKAVIQLLAE